MNELIYITIHFTIASRDRTPIPGRDKLEIGAIDLFAEEEETD